ncbi:tyrosine-protein phosphatase [Nonlabens ponticola]|nr:CpsB/CapC family capsule biosynthesis tyrosine phosphatase [Nonlabens ponticola]
MHNHVLPAIDDGSPDIDTTGEMLDLYAQLGFSKIYATPHTMEDYYSNDVKSISDCYKKTIDALKNHEHASLLSQPASEYMMDASFEKLLDQGNYMTLPDEHLLFEFSYFQKPIQAEELIFKMQQLDLKPILAHPERYRYLKIQDIIDLKNRGCKLQLNLLSLSGHYGKDAFEKSKNLLQNGKFDLVATDAHKPAHLEKIKELMVKKSIHNDLKRLLDVQSDVFK